MTLIEFELNTEGLSGINKLTLTRYLESLQLSPRKNGMYVMSFRMFKMIIQLGKSNTNAYVIITNHMHSLQEFIMLKKLTPNMLSYIKENVNVPELRATLLFRT